MRLLILMLLFLNIRLLNTQKVVFKKLQHEFEDLDKAKENLTSGLKEVTGHEIVVDSFDNNKYVWHSKNITGCDESQLEHMLKTIKEPDGNFTREFKMAFGEDFGYEELTTDIIWEPPCERMEQLSKRDQVPAFGVPSSSSQPEIDSTGEQVTTPEPTRPTSTTELPTTVPPEILSPTSTTPEPSTTVNSSVLFDSPGLSILDESTLEPTRPTTTTELPATVSTEKLSPTSTTPETSTTVNSSVLFDSTGVPILDDKDFFSNSSFFDDAKQSETTIAPTTAQPSTELPTTTTSKPASDTTEPPESSEIIVSNESGASKLWYVWLLVIVLSIAFLFYKSGSRGFFAPGPLPNMESSANSCNA